MFAREPRVRPRTPGRSQVGDHKDRPYASYIAIMVTRLFLPSGTYKITSTLNITEHRVHFIGAGAWSTRLLFAPTTNDTCLQINTSGSVIYQGSVKGICFYSNDSTYTKVALDLLDVSGYEIENIVVGGSIVVGSSSFWSGTNSIGIRTRGRETTSLKGLYMFADRPIVIADNPNNTIDIDHFHFQDVCTAYW